MPQTRTVLTQARRAHPPLSMLRPTPPHVRSRRAMLRTRYARESCYVKCPAAPMSASLRHWSLVTTRPPGPPADCSCSRRGAGVSTWPCPQLVLSRFPTTCARLRCGLRTLTPIRQGRVNWVRRLITWAYGSRARTVMTSVYKNTSIRRIYGKISKMSLLNVPSRVNSGGAIGPRVPRHLSGGARQKFFPLSGQKIKRNKAL